jgi:hypothetical protein
MANYVNLMSERAIFRATANRLVRGWALLVGVLILALLPASAWTWLCRRDVIHEQEALEARYEPIGQLAAANRRLSAEAAKLVHDEQVTLQLSRRRQVVALLAVVGEAIASTEGAAFVQHINASRDPAAKPEAVDPGGRLVIDVGATEGYDIALLVKALNRAPFSAVKVVSSESATDGEMRRDNHVIECLY